MFAELAYRSYIQMYYNVRDPRKKNGPRVKPRGRPEQRSRRPLGSAATEHPDDHDDARNHGSDADEDTAHGGGVAGDGRQMDGSGIRESGSRGRSRGDSDAESSQLGFHDRTLSSLRHFLSSAPYLDRSRARSSPTLFIDVHPTERDDAENNTDSNEHNNSKTSYVRHILSPIVGRRVE